MWFLLFLIYLRNTFTDGADTWQVEDCGFGYDIKTHQTPASDVLPPWHVAIYGKNKSDSVVEYVCSGVLVHPRLILTDLNRISDYDRDELIVATGKQNLSWFHIDEHEKRYKVNVFKMPWKFPYGSPYDDLVALFALNETIPVTDQVNPACIDWTGDSRDDYTNKIGTVVGRVYEEEKGVGEKLVAVDLRHYNYFNCWEKVGKQLKKYISPGVFCGRSPNGGKLKIRDIGGGITFPRNTTGGVRHFLYGLLNIKYTEAEERSIATFTNITVFKQKLIMSSISSYKDSEVKNVCGRRPVVDYRKPNGELYTRRDYPWLATIYMERKGKFFGVNCVGSIVHFKAVITSAWCLENIPILFEPAIYRVAVGKHTLNFDVLDQYEQRFYIKGIERHRKYVKSDAGSRNDLALVMIDGEFAFSSAVLPVCVDDDRQLDWYEKGPGQGMTVSWDEGDCSCQKSSHYHYLSFEDCAWTVSDNAKLYTNFEKACGEFISNDKLQHIFQLPRKNQLAPDKVCGKSIIGTRFQDYNDLGAGFVFSTNSSTDSDEIGKYFILGVKSNGRPSQTNIEIFTGLEPFYLWIENTLDSL